MQRQRAERHLGRMSIISISRHLNLPPEQHQQRPNCMCVWHFRLDRHRPTDCAAFWAISHSLITRDVAQKLTLSLSGGRLIVRLFVCIWASELCGYKASSCHTAAGRFEKSFDKRGRPNWESALRQRFYSLGHSGLSLSLSLRKRSWELDYLCGVYIKVCGRAHGDISSYVLITACDFLDWNSRINNL